jgi:signal peptidase I
MKKNLRNYMILFVRGWIGSILITLLIATSFKSAIADWYVVPTGSMKPTILEGDRIFTNKLAYDLRIPFTTRHIASWDNPRPGEIVIFNSPADGKCLVKRVIGVPGDVIAMNNDQLFINGRPLKYAPLDPGSSAAAMTDEDYQFYSEDLTGRRHTVAIIPYRPALRSFPPVTVPEGRYFMMGDNRDNSADSRYFGFVDRRLVLGRALAVVISLDLGHHYQPRWTRFFTRLE